MRVCVIGTGYVGLVTGACLAYIGHDVICVDNNEEKVKLMKSGQSPIHEPGLPEVIAESIRKGKIEFTTDIAAGVNHGEILFIAVGTPSLADGRSDMRYVEAVARSIGESLTEGYRVIVNKSTVPIGSGDWVRMIVLDGMAGKSNIDQIEFDVVSNPEFLREGVAVFDTFNPDRIVLGSGSDRALKLMQDLYTPIIDRSFADDKTLPPVPVVITDLNSAEMIKYAANAFLATKISFINEVANICDRVGADVREVAKGIGLDSRIGSKFLQAGIGWGGSCFGKDVSALIYTAEDYGYSTEILKACVKVNELQRTLVVEKLQQALKILKGKTIGLLGMTFKPDTDDMRDAPALTLIDQLNRLGARVKAYDPLVSQSGLRQGFSNVIVETDLERLADGCDAVVLVTDWQEFLAIDYVKMLTLMAHPVIIDARNFLDGKALKALGYQYIGIGR
ncbi:MAG: UDP-glucose dehydrogenase family protein [Pseudanabaena sp.]|jgi:UDPglucose 6-dehydrogenase|nr:UDP-glucose/GDP-mannose dehydrogenase family protein [Pseudanabaena sp. M090S1SP2A07QC]MCA6505836.1 UDP-glucose/GDP-mannose dehydrogenase family protein [Pseudanabaena sp. M172S2SP2A07QC]MCA6521546.1 UDP-glucose/GDP-mannose dehydrogenase family protein [Pseudanabaena sp. M051S1SP2A07QC]MCA6525313.1 UDP-glucose/GDP-mannose dehydrogenase family protein [Pseudanabaena sp. M179S2SP2A07QC]MCA6528430.1 UDP-glucose/GDP-mannose dehydrogenase family protein [Pseudanabaena sp. M125S2SP2A07QC]MCA65337